MEFPNKEARDEMARRVAARLAPEVGPKLPAYVERLIALGDEADDEVPAQRIDNAVAAALASVVLAALGIVQTAIYRHQDERRRRLAESAVALTRETLARELRAELEEKIRFPEEVPSKVRVALVESVVEEGLEEAKRLEGKP